MPWVALDDHCYLSSSCSPCFVFKTKSLTAGFVLNEAQGLGLYSHVGAHTATGTTDE